MSARELFDAAPCRQLPLSLADHIFHEVSTRAACLAMALDMEDGLAASARHSIMGGLTPKQRAQLSGARREAARDAVREDRSADPTIQHGTLAGYQSRRCSCDACRAAANAYQREHRRRAPVREDRSADPTIPHGTRAGYQSRRCSCDACRAAANAYQREHYRRAREVSA